MTKSKIAATLAGVLLAGTTLAMAGGAQAANLINNGSFENPVCTDGAGYCNVASLPSWTVTTNNVDIVQSGVSWGTATDGKQMLDLVGFGSTGGISQDFSTVANKKYLLKFDYASNGAATTQASVNVTNGSGLPTLVTSTQASTVGWTTFSQTFVAGTTGTNTLSFLETIGGNNGGVFLDNISISAVPEPATWALMLVGFGGLGAALRSNRRRVAALA